MNQVDFEQTASLRQMFWKSEKCQWVVYRARGWPSPSDLVGATYFVGVSLKNKNFSRVWFKHALADIFRLKGQLKITLVDGPYFSAAKASLSGRYLEREFGVLNSLKAEAEARIVRLAEHSAVPVEKLLWSDLEDKVPHVLRVELLEAFRLRQRVFRLITRQTELATSAQIVKNAEIACEFLLCEIPTLIHIYYGALEPFIDLYPGPNATFFGELEAGMLKSELPFATKLAKMRNPLVYADVRHIARNSTGAD